MIVCRLGFFLATQRNLITIHGESTGTHKNLIIPSVSHSNVESAPSSQETVLRTHPLLFPSITVTVAVSKRLK